LRDAPFLLPLSEGKHFLFREIFMRNFEKHIKKKALQTGSSLHIGTPGVPGRSSFTGTFERKRKMFV
jgi:hypothetical protein